MSKDLLSINYKLEKQVAEQQATTERLTANNKILQSSFNASTKYVNDLEAKIERLKAQTDNLIIALHDAIRRPMGVVPRSAEEFYDAEKADKAELRRIDTKGKDGIISGPGGFPPEW